MSTTGGERLKESIRQAKAVKDHVIEIGFKDPRIAPLAAHLEFGGGNLPERPAFRAATRRAESVWSAHTAKFRSPGPTKEQLDEAARDLRETYQDSYRNFTGAPLSRRQQERKEGTPGAGRLLVGHEGEKLISHLKAFVDDEEVP